jgi:hypothetical protein
MLDRHLPANFDDKFIDWMVFLRDNLNMLRKNATSVELDSYQQRIYRYRPETFLDTKHFPIKYMYIFLLVNYIASTSEFYNLNKLYIPRIEDIETLEREFLLQESSKNIKKIGKL